jgi:hypothetical protein
MHDGRGGSPRSGPQLRAGPRRQQLASAGLVCGGGGSPRREAKAALERMGAGEGLSGVVWVSWWSEAEVLSGPIVDQQTHVHKRWTINKLTCIDSGRKGL